MIASLFYLGVIAHACLLWHLTIIPKLLVLYITATLCRVTSRSVVNCVCSSHRNSIIHHDFHHGLTLSVFYFILLTGCYGVSHCSIQRHVTVQVDYFFIEFCVFVLSA